MKASSDSRELALIEAEFMRQVYLAERMRQARMAGLLPVPDMDPLGLRLLRRAHPEDARLVE